MGVGYERGKKQVSRILEGERIVMQEEGGIVDEGGRCWEIAVERGFTV